MKDGIDYMPKEAKAGWNRDVTTATSVDDAYFAGWRAALEAANARAEVNGGEERARYFAKHKCPIFQWRPCKAPQNEGKWLGWFVNEYTEWIVGRDIKSILAEGYKECTTEAEARMVAGFAEEKP